MINWKPITGQRELKKNTSPQWAVHLRPQYSHVTLVSGYPILTTKISWMHSERGFITHGAPLSTYAKRFKKNCLQLHLHCKILFTRQRNINQHFSTKFGVNQCRSTTSVLVATLCPQQQRQRWVIRVCFFVHGIAFCVKRLNVCFTFLFYSSVIWTNYCLSMERGVISVSQSSSCTLSTRTSAFMLLRWVGESYTAHR